MQISITQKKIIFILFQFLFSWVIITKNIIPFSFFGIKGVDEKDIITLVISFLPSIILAIFGLIEYGYITFLAILGDYRVKKQQNTLGIRNYQKILTRQGKIKILDENQINKVKNAKAYAQSKIKNRK